MSKETIIRLGIVGIALINTVCTLIGWNPLPISDDAIYAAVSAIVSIATTAWAWWKNNSVTKAAVTSDTILKAIKDGSLTIEEVLALIKEK